MKIRLMFCHRREFGRSIFPKSGYSVRDAITEWLRPIEMIESINHTNNSCALKYVAETELGYITIGAFIAAALHLGFRRRVPF